MLVNYGIPKFIISDSSCHNICAHHLYKITQQRVTFVVGKYI